MSELFVEEIDGRKLAHAYVALALARDLADRYVGEDPAHDDLRPLITTLNVAGELLEEILQKSFAENAVTPELQLMCSEMSM